VKSKLLQLQTPRSSLGGKNALDAQLIRAYFEEFGSKYRQAGIFHHYPETKTIPAYIMTHFAGAQVVLDLGFGTGLWFWASFLPSLRRLDGIDSHREALDEADKVFLAHEAPAGYRLAHRRVGGDFTLQDLHRLQTKRGRFVFQDYRLPWPAVLTGTRYDLVTEHGGGLGQMNSDEEVLAVVGQAARVLKPSGYMLFVNFQMEPSALEARVGQVAAPGFHLRQELFERATKEAALRMLDFHTVDRPADMPNVETFFFGYAQK
jgi:hypothetical protein